MLQEGQLNTKGKHMLSAYYNKKRMHSKPNMSAWRCSGQLTHSRELPRESRCHLE